MFFLSIFFLFYFCTVKTYFLKLLKYEYCDRKNRSKHFYKLAICGRWNFSGRVVIYLKYLFQFFAVFVRIYFYFDDCMWFIFKLLYYNHLVSILEVFFLCFIFFLLMNAFLKYFSCLLNFMIVIQWLLCFYVIFLFTFFKYQVALSGYFKTTYYKNSVYNFFLFVVHTKKIIHAHSKIFN